MGIVSGGLFANWRPTPSHSVSLHFNTFLPTNWIRRVAVAYLIVPAGILHKCMEVVSDGLFANWRPTPSHSVSLHFNTFFADKLNFCPQTGPNHYFRLQTCLNHCFLVYGNCIRKFIRQLASDPFHSVSLHFDTFLPTNWSQPLFSTTNLSQPLFSGVR